MIFAILLVANSFAKVAPNKAEKNTPTTVKMIIIEVPNNIPVFIASLLFFLASLEKNATVIGIIGKTHGVIIATKPAKIAVKKETIRLSKKWKRPKI